MNAERKHITKVDLLGFEFEMGLFPNVLDEARSKGIDIAPKYIPAEVFDKGRLKKIRWFFTMWPLSKSSRTSGQAKKASYPLWRWN